MKHVYIVIGTRHKVYPYVKTSFGENCQNCVVFVCQIIDLWIMYKYCNIILLGGIDIQIKGTTGCIVQDVDATDPNNFSYLHLTLVVD